MCFRRGLWVMASCVDTGGYLEVGCGTGKGWSDLTGALDVATRLDLPSWGGSLAR